MEDFLLCFIYNKIGSFSSLFYFNELIREIKLNNNYFF